ncbi:hypothetical protein SSX86_007065 [Deinandra increscens subsp. villosa]|uniref:Uncharacterized protein n=1 Tax=Deinandra increscens subsp. villosa TaxID=3103831 RepID=A0AAP0DKN2_9ASTR
MKIKIMFLMLLSLFVLLINTLSLNGHQELSSHDLAQDHEQLLGFHAIMPRKLMLNPKASESNKEGEGKAPITITTSSKVVSMQEGAYTTRIFTMDYSPVRRRRPVHNKLLPTTTTSP